MQILVTFITITNKHLENVVESIVKQDKHMCNHQVLSLSRRIQLSR